MAKAFRKWKDHYCSSQILRRSWNVPEHGTTVNVTYTISRTTAFNVPDFLVNPYGGRDRSFDDAFFMFFIYEWTFYFIYYELCSDIHTQAYCQRNNANATQKHYRLFWSSIFLLPFVFTTSVIIGHVLNLYSELSIFQILEQLQFFFYTRPRSSKYQGLFTSYQIQRAILWVVLQFPWLLEQILMQLHSKQYIRWVQT